MIKSKILWLFLMILSLTIISGCDFNSQKNEKKKAAETENVISEELHQAHCDLLAKANEDLAGINQKVRELNDKIRSRKAKLSDAQNSALDEFESKQASINKRMHQIKNVKQEDWENFKSTFEKDLEDINALIENIIKEL